MERNLNRTIMKYRNLKESSSYPYEIHEQDSLNTRNRKKAAIKEFENLKQEIIGHSNSKELPNKYKRQVQEAIEILLDYAQKSKTGLPLDRNQGIGIENFVYGKFMRVILDAIKLNFTVNSPTFYYSADSDFDEKEIREILEKFKTNLSKSKFNTFFELEDFVDDYVAKIRELWKNENSRITVGA